MVEGFQAFDPTPPDPENERELRLNLLFNQGVFSRWYQDLDGPLANLPFGKNWLNEERGKEIASILESEIKEGQSVLALGIGKGGNKTHLVEKGSRVFGIDNGDRPTKSNIEKLGKSTIQSKDNEKQINNFAYADAKNIPFKENSFDKSTAVFLFQTMNEKSILQVLEEAYFCAKEGGDLIVLEDFSEDKELNATSRRAKLMNILSGAKLSHKARTPEKWEEIFTKSEFKISKREIVEGEDGKAKFIKFVLRKENKD